LVAVKITFLMIDATQISIYSSDRKRFLKVEVVASLKEFRKQSEMFFEEKILWIFSV